MCVLKLLNMRTIKFRGKRVSDGQWHYGFLTQNKGKAWVGDFAFDNYYFTEVLPETVGQFTGLVDISGGEIYEGDIVKWGHLIGYSHEYWHRVAKVEISPDLQFKILHYIEEETMEKKPTDNYAFRFGQFSYKETHKYLEVIGNIHDNPEML